jgi:uncharacterized membrane protein YkvA (DUF1232 family)
MKTKQKLKKLAEDGSQSESEQRVKRSFLSYFKKNKDKISFGDKVGALYTWLTEGSLKLQDKAIVVGALLYFINPLDVIPDLTPFIGFGDDMGIIYLAYNYLQNRAIEEHPPGDDHSN